MSRCLCRAPTPAPSLSLILAPAPAPAPASAIYCHLKLFSNAAAAASVPSWSATPPGARPPVHPSHRWGSRGRWWRTGRATVRHPALQWGRGRRRRTCGTTVRHPAHQWGHQGQVSPYSTSVYLIYIIITPVAAPVGGGGGALGAVSTPPCIRIRIQKINSWRGGRSQC